MSEKRPEQTDRPPLWDDSAIEEVRAIRRKLWDDCGRDIRRFVEQARQAAEQRQSSKPPKRDAG